jgi:aspartyl aminopeptidase
MIASDANDTTQVLAIFDNEETGSQTKQGAGSPFLSYMLQRIALAQSHTEEAYYQAVERAFMISADNAHAGIQNIFNAYQKDFDRGANRDSGYIYGPSLPRSWFVGAKISF